MPVQRDTMCATWSGVTVSSTMPTLPSCASASLSCFSSSGMRAIGELAGLLELALALRDGELVARLVELLLEVGGEPELLLLGLPLGGQPGGLFLEPGKLLLDAGEPVLRRVVLLELQRLALDLELHDAAVELVERFGLGIDLHPQPRRRLVDEVDRLVGQEAVGDVAVAERRRRHQRGIRRCAPCGAARISP